MERIVKAPDGVAPLPAPLWAYVLQQAARRSKGEPVDQAPLSIVFGGDEWIATLNDDHSAISILKSPNSTRITELRTRDRYLESEFGEHIIKARGQWAEDDPDAKQKAKWKAESSKRIAEIKEERAEIGREVAENGPVRLSIDIADVKDLTGKLIIVGTDIGEAAPFDADAADDQFKVLADINQGHLNLIAAEVELPEGESLTDRVKMIVTDRDGLRDLVGDLRRLLELEEGDNLKDSVEALVVNFDGFQDKAKAAKIAEDAALAALDRIRQELGISSEADLLSTIADLKKRAEKPAEVSSPQSSEQPQPPVKTGIKGKLGGKK